MATQTIDIRVVDKTRRSLSNIDKRLGQLEGSLLGVNKIAGFAAAALGAIGGANIIRSVVGTIRKFEDLSAQLKTVTGSTELANVAMAELEKFASKTTFTVDEVTAAFIILKRSGLDATNKSLKEFGNIAAANDKTFTQFAEAVADAAIGQFERLNEFGIKVSKEQEGYVVRLGKQQIATAKNYDEVIAAIQKLGKEGERYGTGLEDRANTLSGALSNLQDKADAVQKAFGEGGARQAFTDLVKTITNLIGNAQNLATTLGEKVGFAIFKVNKFIKENNFNFGQFLQGAKVAIALLGGAGLVKVLTMVTTGVKTLTLAIARNPLGLLAVAASTLITYLSMENGLGRTIEQVRAVMAKLGELAGKVATYFKNQLGKVIDFLTGIFDGFVDSVISGYNAIAEFVPFLDKIETSGKEVRKAIKDLAVQGFDYVSGKIDEGKTAIEGYINTNDLLKTANEEGKKILDDLTKSWVDAGLTYDQAEEAAYKQYKALYNLNEESKKVPDNQKKIQDAMGQTGGATKEATKEVKKFIDSLKEGTAETSLKGFYTQLKDLEEAYTRINGIKPKVSFAEEIDSGAFKIDELLQLETEFNNTRLDIYNKYLKAKEDALAQSIQYEMQIEKKKLSDLNSLFDTGLLKEIGRNERTQEVIQSRIDFEKKSEKEKYAFAAGQASSFFSDLAKVNKKFAKAAKAAAIVEATINTFVGATQALKFYPPPYSFIAAAAVVASGLAQVAAIRAQPAQRGGALQVGQATVVGEDGPELIVPKQPGTVIPREVAQAIEGMGGTTDNVIVNFNVSTVDAEGFDELLIKRRGTITGIINQALQKRGKQGVV